MPRPDPSSLPCSPLDEFGGLKYLPRLLGKIRLHAAGRLWEELHNNLGKGFDLWLVEFFHLDYDSLRERTLAGGSDEEILAWCEERGRPLNEMDRKVWNAYVAKIGWNDHLSETLTRRKAESGLADRDDIQTMCHYIDADEGRG